VRIAILNNKRAARQQLIKILSGCSSHELAWCTDSGHEAKERCVNDLPDLILMDPLIRDIGGVAVVRHIMALTPCPILIVIGSVEQWSEIVFQALAAGAIDAVNTPALNSINYRQAEQSLLRKINIIEVLTKNSTIKTIDSIDVCLNPINDRPEKNLIAIGCSSGGPGALASLLSNLPRDFQSPIQVIQHIDAEFTSGLVQWLNVKSALPVELTVSGAMPTPGKVLLSAANMHLIMTPAGLLEYCAEPSDTPYRPSVDVFYKSLAQHWKHSVTAILLSGMCDDGAHGMLELRCKGAYTIAQDEATSTVYGMPKAALELGAVVDVLPIHRIADALKVNENACSVDASSINATFVAQI